MVEDNANLQPISTALALKVNIDSVLAATEVVKTSCETITAGYHLPVLQVQLHNWVRKL